MFGNRKSSKHGRVGRSSSRRRSSQWSSSVVGTHASSQDTTRRRSAASQRHAHRSAARRSAEVNQIGFRTRSVDDRTRQRTSGGRSHAEGVLRRRNNFGRAGLIVAIVAIVVVALTLGTCAYRWSLSSNMALNDESVSNALVATSSDTDPYYVLLAGITDEGKSTEAASYIAVLRIDPTNKVVSLLNIPSNISTSYSQDTDDDMLRDAPHVADEGELVTQVSSLLGVDINHYLRITDEDFVSLVDSLGGLTMNVEQYVDDPTVGIVVIDPGEQTLSGEQALTYVSAKNYTNGFGQRATIQNEVLTALLESIESKGSLEAVFSADDMAGKIGTDMSYDTLTAIASLYSEATLYSATVPGSQITSGDVVYWSVNSSTWASVLEEFIAGEDMDVSVDTSSVDKTALSIIVLNGAGVDGYSASAAAVLTNAGYTVQETGNADSFVYDETLVVYKDADDAVAAEAIVQALGTGRAVSAGVYYLLTTDIQVYVGKDWTGGGV